MKISSLLARPFALWELAFAKGALYGGCCLFLVGIGFGVYTRIFIAQSIATTGKVIRLEAQTDSENHTVNYAPVFSFVAEDGKNYTVHASAASNPPEFEEGQGVNVRYIPSNPMRASIDSGTQLWLNSLVFGVVGAVFALIGYLLLRHMQRHRNRVVQDVPIS
ncbi:DUF3592 domain-containing protein [Terracidiphilus gabretensis]|uniref:DUF3592 domain-containing protein n=1 Tax=Terracidiphilus gabretensis TaxID=1577687 RepID=UPI00071B3ADD|nr:DUF3592 domain-containing protein [Terracidiphilus gabretensis]